jgi:hypothetical protein
LQKTLFQNCSFNPVSAHYLYIEFNIYSLVYQDAMI